MKWLNIIFRGIITITHPPHSTTFLQMVHVSMIRGNFCQYRLGEQANSIVKMTLARPSDMGALRHVYLPQHQHQHQHHHEFR